jgi:hemerythrin
MQQYDYPDFSGHKKLHDELTSQAVELNEEVESGQAVTVVSVSNFLKDWIQNHIMSEDMKYAQFIAQHQQSYELWGQRTIQPFGSGLNVTSISLEFR